MSKRGGYVMLPGEQRETSRLSTYTRAVVSVSPVVRAIRIHDECFFTQVNLLKSQETEYYLLKSVTFRSVYAFVLLCAGSRNDRQPMTSRIANCHFRRDVC